MEEEIEALKNIPSQGFEDYDPLDFENAQFIVPVGMFGSKKDYLVDSIIRAVAEYYASEEEWADKYGTEVDNCVFSMKPYCWCDSEDCKWCGDQQAPNFHYKPLDFQVWWYKYIGRGMTFNKDISVQDCAKMLKDCIDIQTN
jgi:hypothetical protein